MDDLISVFTTTTTISNIYSKYLLNSYKYNTGLIMEGSSSSTRYVKLVK